MRTITLDNNDLALSPSVATIGFFDGVHRGHQHLIAQVASEARRAALQSTVITFNRHPRQALHNEYVPQLLTTLEEKLLLLSKTGIDNAVVLPFNAEMASMTAKDFMLHILKERLNVSCLVIGYDNRFGCGRIDGFEEYAKYGREMGIEVLQAEALQTDGKDISSSLIRQLLCDGSMEKASELLGYDYTITGTVIAGRHEGSQIGFPTANIDAKSVLQLVPANGVYAAKVCIEGSVAQHLGMTNIGRRPTFDGTTTTIETNIFDFDDDLYGRKIMLTLVHRMRDEQRFATTEQLAQRLAADREEVERRLKQDVL